MKPTPKPRSTAFTGFLICFALCSGALNYALLTNKLLNPNALTIQVAQNDYEKAFAEPVTLTRQ